MTRICGTALYEDYFDKVNDLADDDLNDSDMQSDGNAFDHMIIVSYIVSYQTWQVRALARHLEPTFDKIVNRLKYIFSNTTGISEFRILDPFQGAKITNKDEEAAGKYTIHYTIDYNHGRYKDNLNFPIAFNTEENISIHEMIRLVKALFRSVPMNDADFAVDTVLFPTQEEISKVASLQNILCSAHSNYFKEDGWVNKSGLVQNICDQYCPGEFWKFTRTDLLKYRCQLCTSYVMGPSEIYPDKLYPLAQNKKFTDELSRFKHYNIMLMNPKYNNGIYLSIQHDNHFHMENTYRIPIGAQYSAKMLYIELMEYLLNNNVTFDTYSFSKMTPAYTRVCCYFFFNKPIMLGEGQQKDEFQIAFYRDTKNTFEDEVINTLKMLTFCMDATDPKTIAKNEDNLVSNFQKIHMLISGDEQHKFYLDKIRKNDSKFFLKSLN